jgi:hypothetical protein
MGTPWDRGRSLNDNPFYTHFLQEAYNPHVDGQMQLQTSPSTTTSTMGWTRNFSVGDFERPRFPEPGVNPFMDAFGCESDSGQVVHTYG